MHKILNLILVFTMMFMLFGCDRNNEKEQIELINDKKFQNGFTFGPADRAPQPENRYPLDYDIVYGEPQDNIYWKVQQFGNIYGLADEYAIDGKEVEFNDGNYLIEDKSKQIIVNPDEGEITLTVNASREYSEPRKAKENWPHLIMEQGLKEQIIAKDVESLILNMDVKLNKSERMMSNEEFDSSLHTAQFLMYIVIRTNNAADGGQFIWFGIPIYDARYQFVSESGMVDAGTSGNTGQFIYHMPQIDFMPNGTPIGEEVSINIDLLPYLERALLLAKEKDFLSNTNLDDLYLTNMNIGFEIPGTYDISVSMKNFSLLANLK